MLSLMAINMTSNVSKSGIGFNSRDEGNSDNYRHEYGKPHSSPTELREKPEVKTMINKSFRSD